MKLQLFLVFSLLFASSFAEDADPVDPEIPDEIPVPEPDPTEDDPVINDPTPVEDEDKNFNKHLDRIIKETCLKHKKEIDPFHLPDQITSFTKTVGTGRWERNVTGRIGFENITLDGLMTIRRVGDAYLQKTKYGNIEMRLQLAIGPLHLLMNGIASFMGLGTKMSAEGGVHHVDGSAVLHYHPPTEVIYVKSFIIHNLKELTLKITKSPLYLTPAIINQILKRSLAIFNPVIKHAAQKAGMNILSRVARESDFLKEIMTKYAAEK